MSPEERQLIAGLFERMRRFGSPEKDRDAEALIGQQIRALPDATYMLVQSVLVQEQALESAQTRIQELEERVQQLEGSSEPPRKSGGFLGGYWGRRDEQREDSRPSSVPQVGARATPPAYESRQPWSQPGAPPAQGAPAGGGFMRSAISTAAGVAGGVLLADSLRSMLGGHGGSAWGGSPVGVSTQQHSADQAAQDAADDAAQDSADDAAQDSADDAAQDAEDDTAQDAADDAAEDAADDGDYGDDFGGDDMDV
jgi:hypothetical protein